MSATATVPVAAEVERELERLIASHALRGSRRSQEFLRYVVSATLRGEAQSLKERTLGVALFHRAPDYDTSDDAIVRVKANEVRRRLIQAYQEVGHESSIEIALPAGSYVPEFRPVQTEVTTAEVPLRTVWSRAKWWLAAALALVVIASGGWAAVHYGPQPPYVRFWEPFLAAEGHALICVPHPVVFVLPPAIRDGNTPTVPRSEVHANASDYIGVGDMMSASRLAAFFAMKQKPYQIRPGSDTSFAEIRTSPAVFVGAFTNQWTMEMSQDLRFVFRKQDGQNYIEDTTSQGRRWALTNNSRITDHAVLTRIFDSRTGRPIIIGAGLGHYGTQAAGEFLTNPEPMNAVLRTLAAGWEKKNIQIVVQVEVIGKTPGAPRVVATHVW